MERPLEWEPIEHFNKGRESEDIWPKEASYGKIIRKYGKQELLGC